MIYKNTDNIALASDKMRDLETERYLNRDLKTKDEIEIEEEYFNKHSMYNSIEELEEIVDRLECCVEDLEGIGINHLEGPGYEKLKYLYYETIKVRNYYRDEFEDEKRSLKEFKKEEI